MKNVHYFCSFIIPYLTPFSRQSGTSYLYTKFPEG
jgi:hypothetical protein